MDISDFSGLCEVITADSVPQEAYLQQIGLKLLKCSYLVVVDGLLQVKTYQTKQCGSLDYRSLSKIQFLRGLGNVTRPNVYLHGNNTVFPACL